MNFNDLLKPHILPPQPERFVVKGIQTHCSTGEKKAVRCVFELRGNNRVLHIVEGGATGHESFIVEDRLNRDPDSTPWCACAGTPHRWHTLDIDGENMAAMMKWILTKLGEIP